METKKSMTEATRARYNRIAPLYDAMELMAERSFSPWRKKLLSRVKGKILEIGVGTGKNFPYYPHGADVTGLDIADKMLARAKKRAAKMNFPIELTEGDVQHLIFPDNHFDTALATFVFCSVPDPVRGLQELRRVVRSEGQILLLEHVRIDNPVIGPLMDFLNPLVVRIMGANINRRTIDNVRKAGVGIEDIEDFGLMGIVKMIVAKANKTS